MAKTLNTRAIAADACYRIIDGGQSLDRTLTELFEQQQLSPQDRGFVQEISYGVCRWYGELDAISQQLLRSPLRKKERIVHFVLLVGLYQLRHLDTAEHAAVAETVNACLQLNKRWANKLVNACLRSYQRGIEQNNGKQYKINNLEQLTHPEWMVAELKKAWPDYATQILNANNQRPPMCLRVNRQQFSTEQYLELLNKADIAAKADPCSDDGIILDSPVGVSALPQFTEGAVSVQETAAQIACDILQVESGQTVLDACAAPGGKSAHLLERTDNQLQLTAMDISARRCQQLEQTLARLQLDANIINADAVDLPSWNPQNNQFDRILIDAPCSGLGVIRRHPDIKHHRRPSDINQLQAVQQALLEQLWKLLKPHGKLLYMTCSVLPQENQQQIKRFVSQQNNVMLEPIQHPRALALDYGVQTLPGVHDMDGFYYVLLSKTEASKPKD